MKGPVDLCEVVLWGPGEVHRYTPAGTDVLMYPCAFQCVHFGPLLESGPVCDAFPRLFRSMFCRGQQEFPVIILESSTKGIVTLSGPIAECFATDSALPSPAMNYCQAWHLRIPTAPLVRYPRHHFQTWISRLAKSTHPCKHT